MNHFAAYTRQVPTGWWVMVRFARDGRPKPIMEAGNKPKVFPTELKATQEALRHVLAYFNGEYLRYGEKVCVAISEADKLFPDLKPIRKNGKVIHVERKRRAA